MRVRPKPPACETRMVSIGVTARSDQTPMRSRIRRLAYDSVIGRKPGAADFLSSSLTVRFESARASARAQPTGPAPLMTMSGTAAGIAHEGLDIVDRLGRLGGEHLAAGLRYGNVVLDAYAEIVQRLGHVIRRAHVKAGLDGERHPGDERTPLARALVFARVVHIQAEPVASSVHIEALVGFLLQHRVERAAEQFQIKHALREHAHGGVVRIVPRLAW